MTDCSQLLGSSFHVSTLLRSPREGWCLHVPMLRWEETAAKAGQSQSHTGKPEAAHVYKGVLQEK